MPPATLSASELLKLPGQTGVAWAEFDAAWYLATYPEVRAELEETDDTAVLQFYLQQGQTRGHSPNIWFDETWHRLSYPDVAAAVRDGHAQSAFDSYCRGGFYSRSAHWLFNELSYRRRYPDLSDTALERSGSFNGYNHYLRHGSREGRIGHPLFDPAAYRAQLDAQERARADAGGSYQHYLQRIRQRRPEVRTSHHFDPIWYLRRYPVAAAENWLCALHHYLTNDTPTAFDPLPEFSEQHYLTRYNDVAAAVEAKQRRNGYEHFLRNGAVELRAPTAAIDLRYYVTANPEVRSDIDRGRVDDAFTHYLAIGRKQGLVATPQPADHVTERQAVALNRLRANCLLPTAARATIDFSVTDTPSVSAIMLLRDQFPLTLMTLTSLRAAYGGVIELILLDAGSSDDTQRIGHFVLGALLLRFDSELDVARSKNAALNCATADTVLFLDNVMELVPGALNAALRRLHGNSRVGAVGGKLVRAHGAIESAGSIVWRDGATLPYLRDGSPLAPEANFVREVDFCSSACLLVRTDVMRRLEGFDEAFAAGDHLDADLCLRIADAGCRVVYDPTLTATRLTPLQPDRESADAQEALFRKHINRLRFHYIADQRAEVFARSIGTSRRVLFIDDMIPLRRLGSGFVRSNDLIQVMVDLGYRVTAFPINSCRFGLSTIYADMSDAVEVMHDRTCDDLAEFLAARLGYYDTIWVARTHNLDRIKPILEDITSGAGKPPRIVLDTEASDALRRAERAGLSGTTDFDMDAAILEEFANAHFCQSIIAVTEEEAQKLRGLGFSDVGVIGHWREPLPTPRAFADRSGILFFGAIHEADSPNHDALDWFVREVLPLVDQELVWETRLTVAGYLDSSVSLQAYHDHPRVTLHGPVEDIAQLYDAHRIVIAPTRYAAGVPYKVHEAASYGVPVVATELLRRQLGWESERDLIAVDHTNPVLFAQRIVKLYRDPALWQVLRDHALERIRAENNRAQYEAAVRQVLEAWAPPPQ